VLPEIEKDDDLTTRTLDTDLKDILDMSIEESGLSCLGEILVEEKGTSQLPNWGDDTDEFLRSMLTGSELSPEVDLGFGSDCTGLSDTSSDSGVVEDPCRRMLLSPGLDDGPCTMMTNNNATTTSNMHLGPNKNINLVDYISCDDSTSDPMLGVDPVYIETPPLPLNIDLPQIQQQQNFTTQKSLVPITPAAPVLQTARVVAATPVTLSSSPVTLSSSPVTLSSSPVTLSSTPVTLTTGGSMDPLVSTSTGTTTIILPAIGATTAAPIGMTFTSHRLAPRDPGPLAKRRRVSASSTDSGMDDKYPRLEMNDEELKMAAKEGMAFPKYYPLTREEERNLKKIRRKIRNKISAQDSRKRKREYLDTMEDKVKICNDENEQLKEKIEALESQNKTLAAQLRRLHQLVVSGGARHGQTSTALMVLLLSTALFLIPGLSKDQAAVDSKAEIDIQAAIKMPPVVLPGQSRSLLQFTQDNTHTIADLNDFVNEEEVKAEPVSIDVDDINEPVLPAKGSVSPPQMDHDYAGTLYTLPSSAPIKMEPGKAWIEEDAPPMGYGSALKTREEEDRQVNVNVTSAAGQGTRTVVLQIPKGIQ